MKKYKTPASKCLAILSLTCFFILVSGIILTVLHSRNVSLQREISSIECKLHEGDKILAKDAYFYTIKLKNGIKINVTLYAYGKEAEAEIFRFIQNTIS